MVGERRQNLGFNCFLQVIVMMVFTMQNSGNQFDMKFRKNK